MSDCVEFAGYRNAKGYGRTSYKGRSVTAHRLAYAHHHGLNIFTMGGVVMHSCDNPPCVNPGHLSLGTDADNSADKVRKGRQSVLQGQAHGSAKLSDADVLHIRATYSPKAIGRRSNGPALCVQYGISANQLSYIIRRIQWRHI